MSAQLASCHVRGLLDRLRRRAACDAGIARHALDQRSALQFARAELLVANRAAAEHRALLRALGDQHPVTSRELAVVLVEEQERADDLAELLQGMPQR